MLSSCAATIPSWAPPAPRKSSPATAPALQLRRSRQQLAAAASVAALRWGSRKESQSRAAIFARYALEQDKYNIEPSALVHPRAFASSDWSLGEDPNRITLSFNVGVSTTDAELEVATTEDQTLLVIRYKEKEHKSSLSPSPARSLDVRLLMPPGYDANKMQGIMWNTGWLEISIPKPKHERVNIPITPSTKTQQPPTQ